MVTGDLERKKLSFIFCVLNWCGLTVHLLSCYFQFKKNYYSVTNWVLMSCQLLYHLRVGTQRFAHGDCEKFVGNISFYCAQLHVQYSLLFRHLSVFACFVFLSCYKKNVVNFFVLGQRYWILWILSLTWSSGCWRGATKVKEERRKEGLLQTGYKMYFRVTQYDQQAICCCKYLTWNAF